MELCEYAPDTIGHGWPPIVTEPDESKLLPDKVMTWDPAVGPGFAPVTLVIVGRPY